MSKHKDRLNKLVHTHTHKAAANRNEENRCTDTGEKSKHIQHATLRVREKGEQENIYKLASSYKMKYGKDIPENNPRWLSTRGRGMGGKNMEGTLPEQTFLHTFVHSPYIFSIEIKSVKNGKEEP